MKKFWATLVLMTVIIATVNVSHAAKKLYPLTEIDPYTFYQNMGYDVDCSHWERIKGRLVFSTILPEEPLALSKDLPNMIIHAESGKNRIVEVDMFLVSNANKNLIASFVAKVINSLDPEAFKQNQSAIEQNISQLVNSPTPSEIVVNIDADRSYNLYKEEHRGKVLAIYIEDVHAVDAADD